jgi:hypothetical protein
MTEHDGKIISFLFDRLTKVFLAQTEKILAEIGKRNRGPKPVATSIKLQRARNNLAKCRAENRDLHRLLDKALNK